MPPWANDDAFGNDVYCVNDVTLKGAMASITSFCIRKKTVFKHNITMSEANYIIPSPLGVASFFYEMTSEY